MKKSKAKMKIAPIFILLVAMVIFDLAETSSKVESRFPYIFSVVGEGKTNVEMATRSIKMFPCDAMVSIIVILYLKKESLKKSLQNARNILKIIVLMSSLSEPTVIIGWCHLRLSYLSKVSYFKEGCLI